MYRDLQKGKPSEEEEIKIKKIILKTLRKYFGGTIINEPEELRIALSQKAEQVYLEVIEEIYEQLYPESKRSE